ncbi:pyridoxine kinase [Seinonella peptonophila]|uniref:pyridoxal kinase n=1 Tax=Seinonella peptonophila TaxID=112248 RepID=A0A1M4SXD6_9BACL|nr:pyridoxine/pyridoxal/pyridoxamine kinase [Seinonella peptonophila]SHE36667.1 pyridoxine kinase [Seinonella peptonophila]
MSIPKVITIAGSDSSGGAGIQADLKTFQELGVYGMTALTTIVAMDPDQGWNHLVFPVNLETVQEQTKTILEGIGVDALKTGMLGSVEIIEHVAQLIDKHQLERVVIDPVMVCKGTDEVLHPETAVAIREKLVPRATIVTPNLFEAGQLSQTKTPTNLEEMKQAASIIKELGAKYVLIKGGSKLQHEQAIDLLYDGETFTVLESERINTTYVHGAGCTYAAAITAELSKGQAVPEAVQYAKRFVTEAIRHGFKLNQYIGPTLHMAHRLK